MEEYVKYAATAGMDMICFTDHVDLNEHDYGYLYYSADRFFADYNAVKAKYKDIHKDIKICAGIEFGEPHIYIDEWQKLVKYPYDYIIGSIHWLGSLFPTEQVRAKHSAKEYFTWYWDEVLRMVKHGGFDALGHIDFPKRYYGELYYTDAKIKEIYRYLLDKDMLIEINTSSLRKGLTETMPGEELLELYKESGGKYVILGSDAHEVKDLGAGNAEAKKLIEKYHFQEVVFEKRKRMIVT